LRTTAVTAALQLLDGELITTSLHQASSAMLQWRHFMRNLEVSMRQLARAVWQENMLTARALSHVVRYTLCAAAGWAAIATWLPASRPVPLHAVWQGVSLIAGTNA
jgi:hypothetical protein